LVVLDKLADASIIFKIESLYLAIKRERKLPFKANKFDKTFFKSFAVCKLFDGSRLTFAICKQTSEFLTVSIKFYFYLIKIKIIELRIYF
jgi:hypothetical protein